MRIVVQRVSRASVSVDGIIKGRIERGFMCLVGIKTGDTEKECETLAKKLIGLRIFSDENGKTNLSLSDVGGALLLISQFTLLADCKKGNRPFFGEAMEPIKAEELFNLFTNICKNSVPQVETGVFGAEMQVELVNDGPFTIVLDSEEMKRVNS